jgi:hypothetical protein
MSALTRRAAPSHATRGERERGRHGVAGRLSAPTHRFVTAPAAEPEPEAA